MQNNISLLDCTLRDGGYINDWDFGHSAITGTYKRLDKVGVEFIEVGFLDDRRPFDINRTIMPSTQAINKVFSNVPKKNAIPVAMIDYGTCSIDSIDDCDETFIDGIRVIFKKEKIDEALPFCQAIKEKGYKLFIQAISITAYSDIEMLQYIDRINEIKPYAFSIVDTYGLLDKERLTKYFYLIDNNLDPEIRLGYHAHNNFQLGFSNSIEFLSMKTNRDLIVDSTVYGMGKSAGNCPTELISMHMNQYYDKRYDISQVLEIIDTDLMTIYQEKYWGYTYKFYISALHDCHPNYVQFLLDKKTLSVSSINEILHALPEEKRLLYDEEYIRRKYLNYQVHAIEDADAYIELKEVLTRRKILAIGPGSSIIKQNSEINQIIEADNPIIISLNFSTDLFDSDYIFISNAKRYSKLADSVARDKHTTVIATSNISELDYQIRYRINYASLLMDEAENADNALVLFLNFLIRLGIDTVYLAGFDGYKENGDNYYKRGYNYASDRSINLKRNRIMSQTLSTLSEKIGIRFITDTEYNA